jgi:beta-glucosidase/6-phospho-beta-glucosidase/beta-galactosidase
MPNHRPDTAAGAATAALPFMFATGVENSSPTIGHGRIRRDQMAECGHYDQWKADFALVKDMGIRYLRYGVPLYRTWLGADRYDWEFSDLAFAEMRRLGIEPIVDLCHFGLPDWLGNFQNPDFPAQFERYAGVFAARYPWVRLYTPVNEMYICARASALYGWWNEQQQSHEAYVRALRHLARANVLAMHAILHRRPDALFIQSESTEYFHAATPGAVDLSSARNERRFLSLDLNYGRPLEGELRAYVLDNGMPEEELRFFEQHALRDCCILGTDYYDSNEHHVADDGSMGAPDGLLGYAAIAHEYWQRYGLPLMHTETNTDQGKNGDEAVVWLRRQWMLIRSLMHCGVPVLGFTWYALNDQIDWDVSIREQRGTVNPRGLVDLERQERPVGRAYRELIATWSGHIPLSPVVPAQAGT